MQLIRFILHDLKRRELIAKLPKKISQEWTDKFDMEDAAQLLEEMNTPNRRVYCAIDKDRHASTGLECKPFHIDWVINEKEQWMKAEYNDYSSIERGIKAALRRFQSTLTTVGENKDAEGFDDSSDAGFSIDTVIESYRESEESSEASEAETEEKEVFSSGASVVELPSSLAALNGLPEDRQRAALLELRARYGSVKSVAQKLNCSESLLEKRCKKLGVTKEAVQKYAAGLTK